MVAPRFLPIVLKELARHRLRTLLTVSGVAVAMFLFVAVTMLQDAVGTATRAAAGDATLIVYRENRFCPATSRLPQRYGEAIRRLPGVASVVPMLVVVSNCRAALDVITFRGVPTESLLGDAGLASRWSILEGSIENWQRRSDAALVGEVLAARRGLKAGQSFDSSGVTVNVAGIFRSQEPQDQNVAYVHLDFLQQGTARGGPDGGLGVVTQFTVRVAEPLELERVASAIDATFRTEAEPTATRPEKAFVAQAGSDIVAIVRFTRWLGWGCLVAVLALIGNAIALGVQDRIRPHAVLRSMGFRSGLVLRLVVCESLLLGLMGGAVGAGIAVIAARWGNVSLSQEGFSINVVPTWSTLALGLLVAAGAGIAASVVPAWRAGRRDVAASLRAT